jgi:uncharacterized membrane protein YfcA
VTDWATGGAAIMAALLVVGVLSGATASVVGFGIGSMLTPLLAMSVGMSTAVALVAVPHAVATAVRCWRLRASIDRLVALRFGVMSAIAGLGGALLLSQIESNDLTRVLGALLILTAIRQFRGTHPRWDPRDPMIGIYAVASGFFGGIAGNQGGFRAAALASFGLTPAALVATSTAIGLLVDVARTPVYIWRSGGLMMEQWWALVIASVGVLIGTVLGERVLMGMSRAVYARVLGGAIGLLGLWLLFG